MAADLRAEQILELEFEYANKTAEQAQDDRTAIVNLYLLLVGGVGSIVVGLSQNTGARGLNLPPEAYTLLFGLLGITGFFMVMKLVRLRQAWYDSLRAMNTIKQFYIQHFPALDAAFHWRPDTIPALGKPWTITFNLCLLIMILDSAAIAVAAHTLGIRSSLGEYTVAAFAAIIFFAWQMLYYFYQLPHSNK